MAQHMEANQSNSGENNIPLVTRPFRSVKVRVIRNIKTQPFAITTMLPHHPWEEHSKLIRALDHDSIGSLLHKAADNNIITEDGKKWYYYSEETKLWNEESFAKIKSIAFRYLVTVGKDYNAYLEAVKTGLSNQQAEPVDYNLQIEKLLTRIDSIKNRIIKLRSEQKLLSEDNPPKNRPRYHELLDDTTALYSSLNASLNDLDELFIKREQAKTSEELPGFLRGLPKREQEDVIAKCIKDAYSFLDKARDIRFVGLVLEANIINFSIRKFGEYLNNTDFLIPYDNGLVLDTETMEVRARSRDDLFSTTLQAKIDPSFLVTEENTTYIKAFPDVITINPINPLEQAVWLIDDFFYKFSAGDEGLKKFNIKLFGYLCSPETFLKKFWIFYGPEANNAKTTYMNICEALLGDYYTRIQSTTLLVGKRQKGAHTADLMSLKSKYLGCSNEFDSGEELSCSFLKEISGNDGIIARDCHGKDMQNFETQIKVIILTNRLPELKIDEGSKSRISVVPCEGHFVESPDPNNPHEYKIDTSFRRKVKTEEFRSAAALLAAHGLKLMLDEEYNEPDKVKRCINAYTEDMDYISQFVSECISTELQSNERIPIREMERHFEKWCKGSNCYDRCRNYLKRGVLKTELIKRGIGIAKTNGVDKYKSIILKLPWEENVHNI